MVLQHQTWRIHMNHPTRSLGSFLILSISSILFAQMTVSGTVTDAATGEALAGANVVVVGAEMGAAADASGAFTISNVPNGATLTVSMIGYANASMTAASNVNFRLQGLALQMSELEVLASRADEKTPVAYTNVTKADMEFRLGSQDIPMALNTTPSVYATGQGGGAGDARINVRGFNQRNVAVMINGVPQNDIKMAPVPSVVDLCITTLKQYGTKTFEEIDSTDIIYSDLQILIIDASAYGIYGCVDNGCCTNNPIDVEEDGCPRLCPESAYFDSLYKSNYPTGCTPGNDMSDGGCYSAMNYYEYANINSNTCHYVSLSIPAFTRGFTSDVVTVPVYLYNDSSANLNSIAYKLSFISLSSIKKNIILFYLLYYLKQIEVCHLL